MSALISSFAPNGHEAGYPSGQRGQTVNLLALPSQVRILFLPPPYLLSLVGQQLRQNQLPKRDNNGMNANIFIVAAAKEKPQPKPNKEKSNMKKKHWRRQILIGTILTASAAFIFFWLQQEERENEVTLEDGSILHYLAALPANTPYTEENLWQQLARKYLPANLQSGLSQPLTIRGFHRGSLNGASFYFMRRNMPEKNLGRRKPTQAEKNLNPNLAGITYYSSWGRRRAWLEAVEEGGFIYRAKEMFSSLDIQHSKNRKLEFYPFSLQNFPRRQRQFPIRLYLADEDDPYARDKGGRLIATFMAKNPFPITNFPEWPATDLPATNVVDGIQVVLNDFEFRKRRSNKVIDTRQGLRSWPPWDISDLPFRCLPYIEVSRVDGKPTTYQNRYSHQGRIPRYQFFEPTGNKGEACELSPQEPVWKLQLKLYRSHDDVFPAEHRGKFANLPVLGDGEAQLVQKTMEVDGVKFRLLFVSGPGSTTISNHFKDPDNLKIHAEKLEQNKKQELSESLEDGNYLGFESDFGETRKEIPVDQGVWLLSWETTWENWKSNYHLVAVNIPRISGIGEQSGPVEDVELLFRFTDQHGRPIGYPPGLSRYTPPRGWIKEDEYFTRYEKDVNRIQLGGKLLADYSEHQPFGWHWVFPLELDEGTQSLNVECIVNRGLTAEFFLRPEDVLKSLETNHR